MDKFLIDLAANTAADSITVEWLGYYREELRFHANIGVIDSTQPHGWASYRGAGPTAEAAILAARAEQAKAAWHLSEAEMVALVIEDDRHDARMAEADAAAEQRAA